MTSSGYDSPGKSGPSLERSFQLLTAMRSSLLLLLRTLLVLAILCCMPLLALPPVGGWVEGQWQRFCRRLTATAGAQAVEPAEAAVRQGGQGALPVAQVEQLAAASIQARVPREGMGTERPAAGGSGQLAELYRQLEQYGVRYSRLEGLGRGRYRFECQVPVGGSVYARTFEAMAEDPVAAISDVLAQLRAWQPSNRQGRRGLPVEHVPARR